MEQQHIVVVGSANMDLVMRVARLPKAGETLLGSDFITAHGGKGANQAVAAARLGARVSFIGCVGNDSFGALQREGLAREGIDLEGLKTHPDLPTGTAIILIADSGQNMIVVAPAANGALLPEDIAPLRACFIRADIALFQLEIPPETVKAALALAHDCKTFSILDASPVHEALPDLSARADLVSPNESEAEALTGIAIDSVEAARNAARQLRDRGVAHVVMKLGDRGCFYLGDEELYMPAFPVQATDATAAGDAFTAALGVAWGRLPLPDVLRFANAAGAITATAIGAQPAIPTLDAVSRFLEAQMYGRTG